MASTYSPDLRIELIGTGDQSGTWGITTNNNLGSLIEQAIAGVETVTITDANYTLTALNGSPDEARNAVLIIASSGALTATRNIVIPSVDKVYIVKNNTTGGQSLAFKTSTGVAVTVPNGKSATIFCDGTDCFFANDYFDSSTVFGGLTVNGNTTLGDAVGDTVTINGTTTFTNANPTLSAGTANQVQYLNGSKQLVGDADMTFDGNTLTLAKDASISGLTVGKGAGSVASNTAVGKTSLQANTTGANNSAFGVEALYANTTGGFNSAHGFDALANNSTGSFNTSHGAYALVNNTTASSNTAVGYQAGYTNATGTRNVFLGSVAGFSTTGSYCSYVGAYAGYGKTGAFNTAVGDAALYAAGAGTHNTALGASAGYSVTSGTYNSFVGVEAGYVMATGTLNTAVGYQSLYANQSGSYNVALGTQALANSVGSYNTAVGYQAGNATTSGNYNASLGYGAHITNTTGAYCVALGAYALFSSNADSNVAVGYQAGYNITSGGANTAIGHTSLVYATTAAYNTAVGFQSGQSVTTGGYNTALGSRAMYSNQTGIGNIAVGEEALYSNLVSSNTAVGYAAMYGNTTGAYNVAIGGIDGSSTSVMRYNTTGSYNIAIGNGAMAQNTTGNHNLAIGYLALQNNQAYSQNTAIGNYALYQNVSSNNTAVGYNASFSNTSGGYNTAVGTSAGASNTSANYNISVGFNAAFNGTIGGYNTTVGSAAGYSNVSGAYKTMLGYAAGYYSTGSTNTFVGYAAGYNVTTGEGNCFVGSGGNSGSGGLMTTGGYNTIIGSFSGNQGGLDIRTSNGWIVLSDGYGSPRLVSSSAGYVGVATTSPRTYFDWTVAAAGQLWYVAKGGESVSSYIGKGSSDNSLQYYLAESASQKWYTGSAERMQLDASGNLIVGSSIPYWSGASTKEITVVGTGTTNTMTIGAGSSTSSYSAAIYPTDGGVYFNVNSSSRDYVFLKSGGASYATVTAVINNVSDYRLKENVKPLTGALDRVTLLKPVVYNFKASVTPAMPWGTDECEGFLAHEFGEVIVGGANGEKDAVMEDGSIKPQGIDMTRAIPLMVAAIQELTNEVKSLKAELAVLKGA